MGQTYKREGQGCMQRRSGIHCYRVVAPTKVIIQYIMVWPTDGNVGTRRPLTRRVPASNGGGFGGEKTHRPAYRYKSRPIGSNGGESEGSKPIPSNLLTQLCHVALDIIVYI
jgi:hypothetical protein